MNKITLAAGVFAVLAAAFSWAAPVQAGTCQTVKAKGVAKDLKTATLYAQADLKQTAKSMLFIGAVGWLCIIVHL